MTTMSTTTAANFSTENPFAGFNGLTAGSVTVLPGKFRITLAGGQAIEAFGAFTYVAGVPSTGTITSLNYLSANVVVRTLTGLILPVATAIQRSTATPTTAWATVLAGNDPPCQ